MMDQADITLWTKQI